MLSFMHADSYGSYGFAFSDPAAQLRIQLRSIGWEKRTSTDYNWDGLKRREGDSLLFQYTLNGYGLIELPGHTARVEREHGFLVRIPGEHRYYLPIESESWEFIYIMLKGNAVTELWPLIAHADKSPVQRYDADHPAVRFLMNAYRDCSKHHVRDAYQASGIAYQFMMELIRSSDMTSAPPDEQPEPVRRAIDYMQQHYAKLNGLDDLGDAAGLSKFHFARLFHKSTGLTSVQYLTNVRMEKAVELLRLTDLTMEEIAARIGYSNGNYFCKVFRNRAGMSPGEFRNGKEAPPVDHLLFR